MNTETEALAVQPTQATPMDLLRMAISQDLDIDKLAKLMELQKQWEAGEARKAFIEAMSAFKAHTIHVVRDKTNTQYQSKYVSLGNLVQTVTPFLSQHGLSVRWDQDQTSGIKVSCIITHSAGHSESVSMTVPPDTSGAKNPIQQIKSAITYAKACTFESICGLASSDATVDDDGNGATTGLSEELFVQLSDGIANAGNLDELKRLYAAAYKQADKAHDKAAQKTFIEAKNKRYRELAQ